MLNEREDTSAGKNRTENTERRDGLETRLNESEEVNVLVGQTRYLRSEREDGTDQSSELSCTGRYIKIV